MTEIEERAWNAAVARMQGDISYSLGYKDGATEQRKIDIDKACEWLRGRYPTHYMEYAELAEQVVADFRRAMEE